MAAKGGKKGERGGIVIRREEVVEGGHHGGAWKVAYADFVTAMMAFFLLMWLLNATTEDQRKGLADYFTPSNALSHASSGSGKPFGGHTPFDDGSMVSDRGAQAITPGKTPPSPNVEDPDNDEPDQARPTAATEPAVGANDADRDPDGPRAPGGGQAAAQAKTPQQLQYLGRNATARTPNAASDPTAIAEAALRRELERRERDAFEQAAEQIRASIRNDPTLADLARQITIDQTPEGLRIQLIDDERQPMFALGSAVPNERARLLLQKIAPVLAQLPEAIAIAGHTDAAPYRGDGKTNWDLSSERANATRRVLGDGGLAETRFRSVTGNADRDLLIPADPLAAANRRIAIVVLRAVKPAS